MDRDFTYLGIFSGLILGIFALINLIFCRTTEERQSFMKGWFIGILFYFIIVIIFLVLELSWK